MATIKAHTLKAPDGLIRCQSVIDVGAGIRPFRWYSPESHICVEPHGPYADRLEENGFTVIRKTASEALPGLSAEAVYLLDVIEHMETPEGLRVLEMAKRAATKQVVVFTPLGFLAQSHDDWRMGGEYWQTHRSGWMPEDFDGWKTEIQRGGRGFYAIWDV